MMPLSYTTNDPLTPAQERAMDDGARALDALTPSQRDALTADLRRKDIARYNRRMAAAPNEGARQYYARMLDGARRELAALTGGRELAA